MVNHDDSGRWPRPRNGPGKGRQCKLATLLGIAIGAMLADANDLRAVFRWSRRLKREGVRLLGIDDGVARCHATFDYWPSNPSMLSTCRGASYLPAQNNGVLRRAVDGTNATSPAGPAGRLVREALIGSATGGPAVAWLGRC